MSTLLSTRIARGAVAGVCALGLAAAMFTTGTSAADAAPAPGHAKRIGKASFPDPGFAKFGNRYYLYATGGGFPVRSSTSPTAGYGKISKAMPNRAPWVVQTGAYSPWAPDVFAVTSGGTTTYVMYFTGLKAGWGHNCVGVATSSRPDGGFVARKHETACAQQKGYEAIDPSHYVSAKGTHYLIYKVSAHNAKGWDIRAIRMDANGTHKAKGAKSISIIRPGSRMEAPSVIRHGGKAYLFASRGNWVDCSYSTDVWVANSFGAGKFTRLRTVLTSNRKAGLCGPGGATVIKDGATTWIAFHAYVDANHDGKKDSDARPTWVGRLAWSTKGVPHLV